MLSGDNRCFLFCPFVPSFVHMVRNQLWPSPRFCEMQTARGTLKIASKSGISFHRSFFTEGNFCHNDFFFFSCIFSFWSSNSLKLCNSSKGWLVLGESHLSLKPAAAEERGRAACTRRGADCQPGAGKSLSFQQRAALWFPYESHQRRARGTLHGILNYGGKLWVQVDRVI